MIFVSIGLLFSLSSCGYKLTGYSSQVPSHIQRVAIPDFENKTTRFQVEQYITFAVREEFIKRSDMVLVEDSTDADALLEGVINSFEIVPISYTEDASANLFRITIDVNVRFIDLATNDMIFEGKNIRFTDSYNIESLSGDVGSLDTNDFFSQETDTLIEVAEEFAASVVTSILENF